MEWRIKMDKQEVIKRIEKLEQRLTTLQLSMELLENYTEVIRVVTPDDLHSLNLPTDVLCKHRDKVKDGCNLRKLTSAIAINSSEELSSICYEELDKLKSIIEDVM